MLGLIVPARRKGTFPHKVMGWLYVALMMTTALAAFFVRSFKPGGNHAGLTPALIAICKGSVLRHKTGMIPVFLGGLLIAGGLTFLADRYMQLLFFVDPAEVEQMISDGKLK